MKNLGTFTTFAVEREKIRLRREAGRPFPWTMDETLQKGFFCNVYREDDKTTRWFHENIRSRLAGGAAIFACTVFRWFNRIESGEVLKPHLLGEWDPKTLLPELEELPKIVGAAYMVKSPKGMTKAAGLLECAAAVRERCFTMEVPGTLEEMHRNICEFAYVGRFLAYEIVTDLRHTILHQASDIDTWASAGPGCARGLGWLMSDDPRKFTYGPEKQQQHMLSLMREMLPAINSSWPWPHRPWEMREVEHVLCEFAKYTELKRGKRPKRYWRPNHD